MSGVQKRTLSYHDLHITAQSIPRTSIFNLPFRVQVTCTRVGGWRAWAHPERDLLEELLGGEYDGADHWLVLDVAGYVTCDSRPKEAASDA